MSLRTAITISAFVPLLGCGVEQRLQVLDEDVDPMPRLTFVAPSAAGATADAAYEFPVRFADVDGDETWTLYYLSEASASRGNAINTGLPVVKSGELVVSWDTSELPAGAYYLYAELSSGAETTATSAPGPVYVDHATPGNDNPVVTVTAPNGGESLEIGATTSISWTASDANGDALTFTVELSRDAGNTWATLADGLTSSPYSWQIDDTIQEGNDFRIRVRAADQGNGSGVDVSDASFRVYQPVTWEKTIKPMMASHCGGAACHSTGGSYASAFASDDYENAASKGVSQTTDRVVARSVDSTTMPPSGSGYAPLSETEKAQFLGWVQDGKRL